MCRYLIFRLNKWKLMFDKDTAEAQRLCDVGTDHYCSKSCNRCSDSQNVVMLVGGRMNSQNWYVNPVFMALNGSLPSCLASVKNDFGNGLTKPRLPGLFINQGEELGIF